MGVLPDKPHAEDDPQVWGRNARSGLLLFFFYLAVYAGFVGLAAFSPETMGHATPFGPNLAIVYGFGLILGALVLALVYVLLCRRNIESAGREGRR
jgi:uncharacterized membrane protein (DUF485 family)